MASEEKAISAMNEMAAIAVAANLPDFIARKFRLRERMELKIIPSMPE